jgi:hypothetical protein
MKRSLVAMASAAAFSLVLIAAAPAVSTVSTRAGYARLPVADCDEAAEAGRMTFDTSGGTVYVCDGSAWEILAHS